MRIFLVALILFSNVAFAGILHLELGAANYDAAHGNHHGRFQALYDATSALIRKYGPEGTIYLNDISPDGLDMAKFSLEAWLRDMGYTGIRVLTLPGDYTKIEIPKVHSMNLGHPGDTQLANGDDARADRRTVWHLENLAAHSASGLKITSYYTTGENDLIGMTERLLSIESKLQELKETPVRYLSGSGVDPMVIFSEMRTYETKVFRIQTRKAYVPVGAARECALRTIR